jgi:hypothetical protein
MDLAHLDDLTEQQDRGADLTIVHPVTGERMPDIVLTIAGPDSDTARRARLKFSDELMTFRNRPPADELERMEVERLARCVVGWKVSRDGKPVEFSFTNVVRLLTSLQFVREQVERFSQDRAPYFMRIVGHG